MTAVTTASTPDADVVDAPEGDGGLDMEITSGPSGDVTTGTLIAYAFSSPTGVRFECRVDAAAFAECPSPRSLTALAGMHTFEVRSSTPTARSIRRPPRAATTGSAAAAPGPACASWPAT